MDKRTHAPASAAKPAGKAAAAAPADSWRRLPPDEPAPLRRTVVPPHTAEWAECRQDPRLPATLRVDATSIDAVPDPRTGDAYYASTENDVTLDVSRRGVRLRCARPPAVGGRLLLQIHLDGDSSPAELVGRTCWSRVEFVRGQLGGRAVAAVGIELLGGSRRSLERYDRAIEALLSAL